MEVESIAHIRELEVSVLRDIKNSNSIIEIKKVIIIFPPSHAKSSS